VSKGTLLKHLKLQNLRYAIFKPIFHKRKGAQNEFTQLQSPKTPHKGFSGKYSSPQVQSPRSGASQDYQSDYPSSKYNRYSQLPQFVSAFYLGIILFLDLLQKDAFLPIPSPTSFPCKSKPTDGRDISREQASVMASQLIEEIAVLDRLKSRLVDELGLMQEILDREVD